MIRRLLWLAGGVALAWCAGFMWFLAQTTLPPTPPSHADGIVVFTGGADRVGMGLRLLRDGNARQLLVSGVGREVVLRDLAALSGIDTAPMANTITLGRLASSTHGNAQETQEWATRLHIGSLIVVTASYHMPRALAELRRSLPDVVLIPYAVQPPGLRAMPTLASLRLLAGEYSKFLAVELGLEDLAERLSSATEHVG